MDLLRYFPHPGERTLSEEIFSGARALFLDRYASGDATPAELTREYASQEFLLVVDEKGQAQTASSGMLSAYRETAAQYSDFSRWFQEASLSADRAGDGGQNQQVLLASRWLCHLFGLRHLTVEIFLDPPGRPGHTLVQVRGMGKFEAPGAFDIPCAGHVSGVDSFEESLRKELAEELNLSLREDLEDVRLLARYNSRGTVTSGGINHEHRVLYRARLRSEAVSRIAFADGEVAGLAVFSVPELQALVRAYPERVASGLSDAVDYYV